MRTDWSPTQKLAKKDPRVRGYVRNGIPGEARWWLYSFPFPDSEKGERVGWTPIKAEAMAWLETQKPGMAWAFDTKTHEKYDRRGKIK